MTLHLTEEQYNELIAIQDAFDKRVLKYDIESIKVAYIVEFMEWVNTVEFFKSWKRNKGKPKETQLDELADLLAFGLSIANYENKEYNKGLFSTDIEGFRKFDSENFMESLGSFVEVVYNDDVDMMLLIPLAIACEYYTIDELIEAYKKKMKINHQRQENNY